MRAVARSWRSPPLYAARHEACRAPVARDFHTSSINNNDLQTETFSKEDYSNIQIDPENKFVNTAAGELPLSPLMDPSFHDARQKFTKAKPRRTEYKPTKFQRQLARNPYAKALATPMRRCPITATTLPSFFLQQFTLTAHPETGKPWFVPHGLGTKAPGTFTAAEPEAAEDAEHAAAEAAEPEAAEAAQTGSEAAEPPSSETAQESPENAEVAQKAAEDQKANEPAAQTPNTTKTGPTAYVLAHQQLLQDLSHRKSPYFKGQAKLLRMSDHGQAKLGSLLTNATWRADMDAVVLELLRRRAAEGLRHFAELVEKDDREYLVRCERWDGVRELKHRGCLLYLGPPAEGAGSDQYVPPRLSTMDMGPVRFGAKLAVHNLRELLGDEHIRRLREGSALLRDGSLFLLGRQATINLQMLLWKLQGYLVWEQPQGTPDADRSAE